MTGDDTVTDFEYSAGELQRMDEDTAQSELTVDQYERWEKIQELYEDAAETQERIAEEDDLATDIIVHAEPEDIGTQVDVYGNDLLVHISTDDQDFRAAAEALDNAYGDDGRDLGDIDASDRDDIADHLLTMLGSVLIRWNDHDWADLSEHERQTVLEQAYDKWGLESLMAAWADIVASVTEEREERVDVIDKFRDEERRGDR